MPNTKIGVTLYTVRDSVRTPADIAKTLKRVKSMGYENIQLSALGSVDAKELADIIHSEGLHVCATHVAYDRLENELDTLLEEHRLWGCENLAIGGMPFRGKLCRFREKRLSDRTEDQGRRFHVQLSQPFLGTGKSGRQTDPGYSYRRKL